MSRLKLKALEQRLQALEAFETPKVSLEQYATSPHIAARLLHTAQACYGDVEGKVVADLGCGCGVLAAGASLLGAGACVGFDVDRDALRVARANVEELGNVDLVECDVRLLSAADDDVLNWRFDTVVMNPPFGTKRNRGLDMEFLRAGLRLATCAVYSLHKTSTRAHVLRKAADWGAEARVLAELRFDLPASYKFHKRQSVDVRVDFVRVWFPRKNK
ncbi:rRNA N6-adenosine-methyltransferase METTL5 [Bacillus rossius redtenbacheri]|uniref:rRNA N6-adenosine-methyltransferase METTL5 n=1 Tax=Bacillus rossius redtenbacheri TaxID=93214 RepID=UPI002FDEA69E